MKVAIDVRTFCARPRVSEHAQAKALCHACDLGAGISCLSLGKILDRAGEFVKAVGYFEQACRLSDQQIGCQQVAEAYYDGIGVPKDPAKGLAILKSGCDANAIVSCHTLGTWLRDGKGTTARPAEALTRFDSACTRGWGTACVAQAELLENKAYGLPLDPAKAKALRELACKLEPTKFCAPAK